MFHWMSRFGVWGQSKEKLDEYLYIYKYVSVILLKEVAASLYLYGEAMVEVVNRKAALLKLPPDEVITREFLTWHEISNLNESLEDVCLLTLKPIDPRQSKKEIFAQMKKTCEMLLAVYCDTIAMKSASFVKTDPEVAACSDRYMGMISGLYLIGSGNSQGDSLRRHLRAGL
jgi:hypothetical protein